MLGTRQVDVFRHKFHDRCNDSVKKVPNNVTVNMLKTGESSKKVKSYSNPSLAIERTGTGGPGRGSGQEVVEPDRKKKRVKEYQ